MIMRCGRFSMNGCERALQWHDETGFGVEFGD